VYKNSTEEFSFSDLISLSRVSTSEDTTQLYRNAQFVKHACKETR